MQLGTGRPDRAAELRRRAVEAYERGHPRRAAGLFRRAQATLESGEPVTNRSDRKSAELLAKILLGLALSEAELHGPESGLATLHRSAELARQLKDPSLEVLVYGQRGLLLLRCGQTSAALDALNSAAALIDRAEPIDRCRVLLNRGALYLEQGRLAAARADLSRCVHHAEGARLSVLEGKARHNLGYLEFLAGNLPLAIQIMEQAAQPSVLEGISLLDRARVLVESGLSFEADDALARAAAIFRRDRLAQDLGETELERARCSLLAGDVAAARRFAGLARDRFRRRGNDRWRRSAELVLLQSDLAAGRPGSRLVGPALRLQGELDEEGLHLPARTAGLIAAEAYLGVEDIAAAEAVVAMVGAASRRDPVTARLHVRYVRARLDAALGNLTKASRQVRDGLGELARYQASFGSIDLQTASAIHGRRLAELGLSVAIQGRRAVDVFAAAERARAVSTRLPVVRPPRDVQAAELLAELRQTVESLRAGMQDRAASAPLLRRRHQLERAITARGWTLAGGGAARPIAQLAEIRAALATADATMVVFVEVGGGLHAVSAGSAGVRLHELGRAGLATEQARRARADLDVLAQPRLSGSLSVAVRSSFQRSATELDRSLLEPLHLDGRRLVIVSTGILGQLPWGTLPSLHGVPVVVAPSATAWLAANQQGNRRRRHEVIALAGPDLPRARHEVTAIEKAWGAAHSGETAARSALARAMARGTVVHVAAHGVHQTENPLFSSLRLADGPMFAHEMDQTARTPEHVVLSACELGLATVRPGDEALGLTSVLLHLGTRSVVAGVARVGDDLAAETMIAYHQRLAGGQDSAAALAEAASASSGSVPFVCFGGSWRASH